MRKRRDFHISYFCCFMTSLVSSLRVSVWGICVEDLLWSSELSDAAGLNTVTRSRLVTSCVSLHQAPSPLSRLSSPRPCDVQGHTWKMSVLMSNTRQSPYLPPTAAPANNEAAVCKDYLSFFKVCAKVWSIEVILYFEAFIKLKYSIL